AVAMRIFPAAVGAPYLHLLPGPFGIRQAVLQFDAHIDLLASHALFLDAIRFAADIPGGYVGEPHARKIRLAIGCSWSRCLQVRCTISQARNPWSGVVKPLGSSR